MIRVYLLDDHEVVRRGLIALLESAGDIEVVGESGLAQEATRKFGGDSLDEFVANANAYAASVRKRALGEST